MRLCQEDRGGEAGIVERHRKIVAAFLEGFLPARADLGLRREHPVRGGVFVLAWLFGDDGDVLLLQAHRDDLAGVVAVAGLFEGADVCQISLRLMPGTRALPRPRQWLWLAGDGCASCPLLQRLAQSFFPWAAPIPRGTKKRRSAPSSTTFRPCGCSECKPLPQTSHRGRE